MMITSSGNHLFANKWFRPDLDFRINSLSARQVKVQQNPAVGKPLVASVGLAVWAMP
jgi:hypothetical protein